MGVSVASGRAIPYALAVLVTILWSSSYVLIKLGLGTLPPIYFAAVRYVLAFAVLAAADAALRRRMAGRPGIGLSRGLVVAGLCGYTVAQGLQYVGLFFLPAITTSLILSFNPVFVLVIGAAFQGDRVGPRELGGMLLAIVGSVVFFYERLAWQGQWFGVLVTVASGVGWAVYVILARDLQKNSGLDSLRLTTVTMGIGAVGLVGLSVSTGEYAPLNAWDIGTIVWLAVANTAIAFYLWNRALASIPAYHLTVLQNAMLVEIALFSVAFLGEALTPLMVAGMALVLVGVVFVQLRVGRAPR